MKKCLPLLILGTLFLAANVSAVEFQLGVSGVILTPEEEDTNSGTSIFPSISIGGEVSKETKIFFEYGQMEIEIEETLSGSVAGIRKTSLTSTAAILAQKFGNIFLRFGFGRIAQEVDYQLTSYGTSVFVAAGLTDPRIEVEDASGSQFIYGLDIPLGESSLAGFEYRTITMQINAKFYDGGTLVGAVSDLDSNYSWMSVKLTVFF